MKNVKKHKKPHGQIKVVLQLQAQRQLQLQHCNFNSINYITTTTTATTTTTPQQHIQLQLHCASLPHNTSCSCVWSDHCDHSNNHNHFSVHQWIRRAIHALQQLTSPIFPPPPCAVLLVKCNDKGCWFFWTKPETVANHQAWDSAGLNALWYSWMCLELPRLKTPEGAYTHPEVCQGAWRVVSSWLLVEVCLLPLRVPCYLQFKEISKPRNPALDPWGGLCIAPRTCVAFEVSFSIPVLCGCFV